MPTVKHARTKINSQKQLKCGIVNEGYEYEKLVPAYFALELLLDPNVKNFFLTLNSNSFRKFDDLVVSVVTTNSEEHFAIQLKHRETGRDVLNAPEEFHRTDSRNKAKSYNIASYHKAYDQEPAEVQEKYKFILFTNVKFLKMEAVPHYEIREVRRPFFTDLFNVEGIYQFKTKNSGSFWNNFFLISAQKKVSDIDGTIIKTFVDKFNSDEQTAICYINFFQRLRNNCYTSTRITRSEVVLNLVRFLVAGTTISCPVVFTTDPKINLVERALKMLNFAVLNIPRRFVETFWKSVITENVGKYTAVARDLKFLCKNENMTTAVGPSVLSLVMGKPLFLYVTEASEKLMEVVKNLLATLEDKVTVVLVGSLQHHQLSLRDLSTEEHLYRSIIESFRISLQGRETKSIKDLQVQEVNIDHLLTPTEIFQFLKGDLLVGKKCENFPEFFIPRTLRRRDLTPEMVKVLSAQKTTVVHCGGASKNFQHLLRLNRHQKSIILTDEELPNHDNYFHLKVTHNGTLQWLENVVNPEEATIFDNDLAMVSGDSGIGKTTFLKYLALRCPLKYWVTTVALQQVPQWDSDVDKMLREFLRQSQELDQRICDYFLSLKNIIFLFDGFNELSSTVFNTALGTIKKISQKGFRVWISCTTTLSEFVEEALEITNIYVIEDLTYEDQCKYVTNRLKSAHVKKDIINQLLEKLFNKKKPDDILKLPLILYILTDNFTRDFANWEVTLNQLYYSFIEGQLHHNLTKTGITRLSNVGVVIEGFKNYYFKGYQLAALQTCLEPDLFAKLGLKVDKTFVESVRRNGDYLNFLKVTNGTFTFSHRTFGEYFAAMWLSNNFEEVPVEELGFIFRREYEGIKRFFDARLAEGCPLHVAVLEEDLVKVRSLRESNTDGGGRTALHVAASYCLKHQVLYQHQDKKRERASGKMEEVLKCLLDHGAKPSEKDTLLGWNSFEYADASLCLGALEEMSKTEKLQWKWLATNRLHLFSLTYHCATMGYVNLLEVVLKNVGLEELEHLHVRKPLLHLAIMHHQDDVLKLLISHDLNLTRVDFQKWTPLHEASISGSLQSVNLLLDHGVEVDPEDALARTPLHLAAKMGNYSVVKLLVKKRAKVDAEDVQHKTPLLKAAYSGRTEIVNYLLDHGANIHAQTIDRATSLHRAAEMGHHTTVRALVGRGAEVGATEKYQRTALHYAAYEGHVEVVKFLVKHADFTARDEDGNTAKNIALKRKHQKVVEVLENVERKCLSRESTRVKESALHQAAQRGDLDTVKRLLRAGGDVDETNHHGETLLHIAGFRGDLPMVRFLVSLNANSAAISKDGRVPLHLACHGGHVQVVQALLNKGQNSALDKWKLEPIHRAAYKGHIAIVELLINAGVDINTTSGEGLTPLHSAAYGGHVELLEWLLEHGADIERKQKKKETCLHVAVQKGWMKAVDFLVKRKRDIIDEVDCLGRTALHLAAQRNSTDLIDVLVKMGADVEKVDYCGKTALDVAVDSGRREIVRYLKKCQNK